jgi:hypothetical protein
MIVGGGSSAAEEPQLPQPSLPVDITPVTFEGAVLAKVDMAQVPETPQLAEGGAIRTHIQGEFVQHEPVASTRSPITKGERGVPTVELDLRPRVPAPAGELGTPGDHVVAFEGAPASGWIPPDTVAAVGREYIVEAVNSGFQVYTKTGTQTRAYTDFESFVNLPPSWNGFCYDPRVVYDSFTNQFLMLILGLDTTNLKSYFWIMVSLNENPNGQWFVWRCDATTGAPGAEEWLDFASLGTDARGVYVVGNSFGFAQGSGFQQSRLWSFNRDLMTGGNSDGRVWNDLRWPNNDRAFGLQMAHALWYDNGDVAYFVNNYPGSGTQVCFWKLSGDRFEDQGLGDPMLSRTAITARTYYAIYNNVDQPGSPWDIDGGDCRIQNAVFSSFKVYTTFGLDWDGSHSYSEAYVLALDTLSNTKAWDFSIWNPDYFMFYPSIAVEGSEYEPNWMVAMSMTVPDDPNGFAGTIALTHDPATDTGSFWWDKLGLGPYSVWDGGAQGAGRNRWGDYSMAVYDKHCDNAWGAAEYATASNSWATRLFARTLDEEAPCAYLHMVSPNGGEILVPGSTELLEWDSMYIPWDDDLWVWVDTGTETLEYGPLDAGETSYSWLVPNVDMPNARVYISAWPADDFRIRAMDSSDSTLTVIGLPDLESAALAAPAGACAGQEILVDRAALNSGVVAVGGYQEELRLSSNATCTADDRLLAGGTFDGLEAGETDGFVYQFFLPGELEVGDFTLCQMIDPGGLLTEFDETNNVNTTPFSILTEDVFANGFEDDDPADWSGWMP